MSRALARLRDAFQDPLLVKGSQGMALTARAKDLYLPLQHILRDITNMVTIPAISPQTMRGEIVMMTRDYQLATILPAVIKHITSEAPLLHLSITSQIGDDLSPLEHHTADFALTGTESNSASLHRHKLFDESFVCMVANHHPVIAQGLDLDTYLQLKHCLVSITNYGLGYVDTQLAAMGLDREIVVRVPHFLAVAHIIEQSDLIVTLPRRLGDLLSKNNKLTVLPAPLPIPGFPVYLYWHSRNHDNPCLRWIRDVIKGI
jgi:DNA-binding transcriptional LysR family regulator